MLPNPDGRIELKLEPGEEKSRRFGAGAPPPMARSRSSAIVVSLLGGASVVGASGAAVGGSALRRAEWVKWRRRGGTRGGRRSRGGRSVRVRHRNSIVRGLVGGCWG